MVVDALDRSILAFVNRSIGRLPFRSRPAWIMALGAIVCGISLLIAVRSLTPEPARVEVDASISSGGRIAVFINTPSKPFLTQPVVPGERRRYVFDGIVEDITMLRVDPSNAAGALVDIHSVVVRSSRGVLARFEPRALTGWTTIGVEIIKLDDDVLVARSVTADPILATRTAIVLHRTARAWARFVPMVNTPDAMWRIGVIALLVLLAAGTADPARRLHLHVGAAALGLVAALLTVAPAIPDAPASARIAVSRATLLGLSTRPTSVATGMLILAAIGMSLLLARFGGGRSSGVESAVRDGGRVAIWLTLAGIAVVTAPGLREVAAALATQQFIPNWDGDNLVYWSYLANRGQLPFRDYWYPYAGSVAFDLRFPIGSLLHWMYLTALFGCFFRAFSKWRGLSSAWVATSVVLMLHVFNRAPNDERYLLAPTVFLAYISEPRDGYSRAGQIVFPLACAIALFVEPLQLGYAGVPVLMILVSDCWRHRGAGTPLLPWIGRRFWTDFGLPALIAGIAGIVLAFSGQLPGFAAFYGRLADGVAYSAWPTGLPQLQLSDDLGPLILLSCAALSIAIGAYEMATGADERRYGAALVGMGVLDLAMMQKHFMRPMYDQLITPAVCSLLVIGLGWPANRRRWEYLLGGALIGAVYAALLVQPGGEGLRALLQSPGRAASDLVFLVTDHHTAAAVNSARFASERFRMYVPEMQILDKIRQHAGVGGDARLFCLTDDPVLYILSGQTVWLSNLYDASPVYRQTRMVRWLRESRPPYVVLNPGTVVFDQFQKAVRVPLVFSETVFQYVPLDTGAVLHLLRRREVGEPIALSYWRDTLGPDINLGRIPSVSSFDASAGCTTGCGDLLEVQVAADGTGKVKVPIVVGGLSFGLWFTSVSQETTLYRVLLDRVWFWDVAKRAGLPHGIGSSAPTGVRIRQVALSDERLY
jgi:hypothetical protein